MNQHHSIYSADCLCGRHFETPAREYVCPACGRHIVLAWGEDRADDESASAASVHLPEVATK
jgi:predicted RNA-binding Zn-ribbon protein involved in translation (DUF1610 family)